MLLLSANHFKKNAGLPKFVPPVIVDFMASFFYLIPIALEFVFEDISDLPFTGFVHVTTILLMILVVLVTAVYAWIYVEIASGALMFPPDSLMTVMEAAIDYVLLFDSRNKYRFRFVFVGNIYR